MTLTCRFIDIDCPEFGQPYHYEATLALEAFRITRVKIYSLDKYNRILVEAFAPSLEGDGNEINVAQEMARQGWAWAISPKYKKEEREAYSKKKGLWIQYNPEPPWRYRKTHERIPRKQT